tara:strand:+ start:2241 stop:2696 length:456 start_codon:yes stop_codon:yes gene_type:complete
MERKTQWTTEELESLIEINNHRIMFDGYEYFWVRMLEDKWERHFILNFSNKRKAFSYLKYNVGKWNKELLDRKKITDRITSYKELETILHTQEQTHKILNSEMPTIEKINHLRLVNNEVSATELSNMLDVSSSMIYRHIRNLEERGSLLCA